MSLRDIVSGSDACTADGDGAGPSNAMGALVNNLLGGTSKQHEQLREVSNPDTFAPTHCPPRPSACQLQPGTLDGLLSVSSKVVVKVPSPRTGAGVNTPLRSLSVLAAQLPVMQQPGMLGGPAPMLNPQQAAMASVAGPSGIAVPGVMPSQMVRPSITHSPLAGLLQCTAASWLPLCLTSMLCSGLAVCAAQRGRTGVRSKHFRPRRATGAKRMGQHLRGGEQCRGQGARVARHFRSHAARHLCVLLKE